MERGKTYLLKDISIADQDQMGLVWAWEAGAKVIYSRPYGSEPYYSILTPCSLVRLSLESGELRDIWVFDMFLEESCLWR
jgi:hypothetical protein